MLGGQARSPVPHRLNRGFERIQRGIEAAEGLAARADWTDTLKWTAVRAKLTWRAEERVREMQTGQSAVFEERRQRVLQRLGSDVLVLFSAPELLRNNDVDHPYRQDSDFFYLTGFEEPESALVLDPRAESPFTLFVNYGRVVAQASKARVAVSVPTPHCRFPIWKRSCPSCFADAAAFTIAWAWSLRSTRVCSARSRIRGVLRAGAAFIPPKSSTRPSCCTRCARSRTITKSG